MKQLRVALIQQRCRPSASETLDYLAARTAEARAQGAELVVYQELHNTTYFCQTENPDRFDLAEPIPGPSTRCIGAIARSNDCVIVSSLFERRAPGLHHNTSVVFERDGSIAGTFRKMHIPDDPGYYEKFYFTPGDGDGALHGFSPVPTSVGKIGVLICWDQWYPEAARLMTLAGAQVLVYPTAIGWHPEDTDAEKQRQLDAWQTIQRAHAIANGLPVIACNRTGFETCPDARGTGIEFWGNSFIAGPQGEFLAQAPRNEECVLCADLDPKRSEDVRRMWPYLRDRRVDAYTNLTRRYID
jgi:N-carbamoylputrescine amidase